MKRKIALIIATTALLAGCGSNTATKDSATSTAPAQETQTVATTAQSAAGASSDHALDQLIIDESAFPAGYEVADLKGFAAAFGDADGTAESNPVQCGVLGAAVSDMIAWTKLPKDQSVVAGMMKDDSIVAVKLDAAPAPDLSGCTNFTRTSGDLELSFTSTTFDTGIAGTTGYSVSREGTPRAVVVTGTVGGHGFTVYGEDTTKEDVVAVAKAQADKLA